MVSAIGPSVAASSVQPRVTSASQNQTPAEIENEENLTEAEADIEAAIEGEVEETGPSSPLDPELTPEEEQIVRELQQIDREVRAHERAHKAVAGPLAGPIQYEFTRGPDGGNYATGGEVSIDTSEVPNDPEATVRKMDIVIRAALAPAEPSSQDRAVARAAQQTKIRAQLEARQLAKEEREESQSENLNALQQLALENQEVGLGENTSETNGRITLGNGTNRNTVNAQITQAIQSLNQASTLSTNRPDSTFITSS